MNQEKIKETSGTKQDYQIDTGLFDNFDNPVSIINVDKTIGYINPAFRILTKFSDKEVVGKKPPYLWWPKEKIRSYSARLTWAQRQRSSQYDHQFIDKDGKKFWVAISLTPIMENKKIIGYISNWVDVTSQQMRNQRITKELYQKEKKLRYSLQLEISKRTEFFRMLVHELKTPMTATLFSSGMLCEQLKDEIHLKLANNINRAITSLNGRVDELMDLAKGEMGIISLHISNSDILAILCQVAEEADIIASRQGKSLKLDLPTYLPLIPCDPNRIRQILQNLLSNAIKFTGEGGEITLHANVSDGNLMIEVQDTGLGINKNDQRWLFTPYYKIKNNEEYYGGLGLGLALCRMLVELHAGKIWVQSEVGKGSKFICTFPSIVH
jgi:two-component system, OmpR family, aerobic respiration control sensor histidine kinase ArcB